MSTRRDTRAARAVQYDEFDNALEVMMAHDAVAWEHVRFKDVAVKCSTVDIFYKAVQHYFDHHPDLVVDLLKVLPPPPLPLASWIQQGAWRCAVRLTHAQLLMFGAMQWSELMYARPPLFMTV